VAKYLKDLIKERTVVRNNVDAHRRRLLNEIRLRRLRKTREADRFTTGESASDS
jgi:hypothetical protein